MKEHKHLGAYALVLKDNQILLIKKVTGPYDGKLDLPGGSLEFGETPEKALKRELLEETGYKPKKLTKLGSMSPNPAIMSNHVHFFLAQDLEKVGNQDLSDLIEMQAGLRTNNFA